MSAHDETKDQIAAVMLQHGTPEQQAEALRYAKGLPPAINFEREFHIAIKKHLNRRQQGFVMGEFRRVLALAGVL